jgi:uncharacterized protein YegL
MAKKKVTKTVTVTEEIIDDANEYTHIICLLDKSGSMGFNNIISDAIGSFNTFLKKQKEEKGKATISVFLFDDKYEKVYSMTPLKEANEMTSDVWYPDGMTRLYDAIGKTIVGEKRKINDMKKSERPDKVLFLIATDGQENDSREYNRSQIKKMISDQEEADWKFIYTAAGQDAFAAGTNIGISAGNTFSFSNTSSGYNDYTVTLDSAVKTFRSVSKHDPSYYAVTANLMNVDGGVNDSTTISVSDGTTTDDNNTSEKNDEE